MWICDDRALPSSRPAPPSEGGTTIRCFNPLVERLEQRRLLSTQFVGDAVSLVEDPAGSASYAQLSRRTDGFIAVWQQGGTPGAQHRRFDWPATPLGSPQTVSPVLGYTADGGERLASNASGRYVVAWGEQAPGTGYPFVAVRVFGSDGHPLTDEIAVRPPTQDGDKRPGVAIAEDGRFVVAYVGLTSSGDGIDIHIQRFLADGTPEGAPLVAGAGDRSRSAVPAIALANDGTITVVWRTEGDYSWSPTSIRGKRFAWSGQALGESFLISDPTESADGVVTALADDGTLVVTFISRPTGGGRQVALRSYDSTGAPLMAAPVMIARGIAPYVPAVAINDAGEVVVAWTQTFGYEDVMARRVTVTGEPLGAEFRVNRFTQWNQIANTVVATGEHFAVGWTGYFPRGGLQPVIQSGFQVFDDGGDAAPIAITSNTFELVARPPTTPDTHNLEFELSFSGAIGESLQGSDFVLRNLTTGQRATNINAYALPGRTSAHVVAAVGGTVAVDGLWRLELSRLEVGDESGNPLAADWQFTFAVATGGTAGEVIGVRREGDSLAVRVNDVVTLSAPLGAIEAIALDGGAGDDLITLDLTGGELLGAHASQFSGGVGSDTLRLVGTSPADAFDLGSASLTRGGNSSTYADFESLGLNAGTFTAAAQLPDGIDVSVADGATLQLQARQDLGTLLVMGQVNVAAGGDRPLRVSELALPGAGTLDLADNDLIINYSSVSPIGVWSGSVYDGVTGMIKSGRITSSAGSGTLKTLAVAEARDALGISGTQTAIFSEQAVDSTSVLVRLSWGGDANLDARLNIDDYGRIDAMVSQSGSVWGWFNGDFNLDGQINIDDYGIIDSNISQQDGES